MHIIAGHFKNQVVNTPKGQLTRPTSSRLREALFNICQHEIDDAQFLDLFAGSGAMGLEAISRGAQKATFIDNSKESIRCIQSNIRKLGLQDQTDVLYGDVFTTVQKLSEQGHDYGLIYADPPYDAIGKWKQELISYGNIILKIVDESSILLPSGMLFIEDSAKSPLQAQGLTTLALKSSRRMGRSVLQQYVKKE